ncbi:MAG: tripartite tricarboxylate transporter TctB family protein [Acetobacteraceae bacterium]|nr:tripartite tricarboxylate transporter TctB family protein [Acetobacteraceae bacterium]
MQSGMRRGWQLTGLVMFLICLVTLWESLSLSLFDRLGPGSGFFPFYLSLIGAVLCGLIMLQVTRAPTEPTSTETIFPRGPTAWRAIAIMGCSILVTLLLDWLGFRLAVMIFSASLLPCLGETRWWAIGLFAVVTGFGLFHLFNDWLNVLLPVGIFGI